MKAMPTLEGGLRIDAEDPSDWELLRSIVHDARGPRTDLADRLGRLISDEAGSEDWQEYVVPDLREAFEDELAQVIVLIDTAIVRAEGGPGPVWITREDVFPWYSALNQARLALEEQFKFGQDETLDTTGFIPSRRAAYYRIRFYGAIQSLLLDYVMETP
jgi:hypothetical protein